MSSNQPAMVRVDRIEEYQRVKRERDALRKGIGDLRFHTDTVYVRSYYDREDYRDREGKQFSFSIPASKEARNAIADAAEKELERLNKLLETMESGQ